MHRAAIIRWIALAKREMQNYEPLLATGRWELLGIGSQRPDHDLSAINFPSVQPHSIDSIVMSVPGLDAALQKLTRLRVENLNTMFGLEKHLANADLVDLAETYHPFGLQTAQFKRKYGFKLVVSVQENIPFTHENIGLRRRAKQAVFENADHFIALSRMAKESLILEGAPAERISIIPQMGIDTGRFQPGAKDPAWLKQLGLTADDVVILFVGRLVWSKGVFDLLWAFKYLINDPTLRGRPLKLVVIGNGEEWDAMQRMVEKLKLQECVRMVQRVPYADMPKLHNIADIFALPSVSTPKWQEQFGAVLAESMASCKPIVGTSSGAIPEVIGDAGLIAQANDYLSLAECLKELIENEGLRTQLGQRGRLRAAAEYDSQVVGAKILKLYDDLMAQS